MPEIPYKTHRTALGKIRFKYQCPKCRELLESEIEEAGTGDRCPGCAAEFVVPGIQVLKQHRAQLAKAEAEKKQAEAASREVANRRMVEELEERSRAEAAKESVKEAQQIAHRRALDRWCNTPGNYKYPALSQYCSSLRFVAYLILALPLIILVLGLTVAAVIGDGPTGVNSVVTALLLIVPCIGTAMIFFIAAQSIQLMLELREDVARLVSQGKDN